MRRCCVSSSRGPNGDERTAGARFEGGHKKRDTVKTHLVVVLSAEVSETGQLVLADAVADLRHACPREGWMGWDGRSMLAGEGKNISSRDIEQRSRFKNIVERSTSGPVRRNDCSAVICPRSCIAI